VGNTLHSGLHHVDLFMGPGTTNLQQQAGKSCARCACLGMVVPSQLVCGAALINLACAAFPPVCAVGPGNAAILATFQYFNLVLSSIGYTVAAGQSLR
jgi:hypothetical protein